MKRAVLIGFVLVVVGSGLCHGGNRSFSNSLGIDWSSVDRYRGVRGERPERDWGTRESESTGESPREAERRQLVDQSVAANNRKDYREALRLARQAVAIRDDPELRLYISRLEAAIMVEDGISADNSGDYRRAVSLYRQGVAAWGDALNQQGKERLEELEHYLAGEDYRRGLVSGMESYQQAQEERLKRDRPQADRLHVEAAELLKKGAYDAAMQKAEEALRLVPNDNRYSLVYWIAKANVEYGNGSLEGTIAALQSALALDAGNQDARRALDLALAKRSEQQAVVQGSLAAVRQRLEDSLLVEVQPVVDPRVAAFADLPRQAEEIENSPGAPEARRGFRAVASHDWEAADALYRQALLKDPGNGALQRMVDMADYMVERRRSGPIASVEGKELPRDGDLAVRRPEGGRFAEVLQVLEQHPGKGVPVEAMRKSDAILDEMFLRQVNEMLAEESAKRAVSHLASGNEAEALAEMRSAAELAPWITNYKSALDAISPGEERSVVGRRPHVQLDFIAN